MATTNPYDPSMDPYDPTGAIRARVRSTLQQPGGADPAAATGTTASSTAPTTPSPNFAQDFPLPAGSTIGQAAAPATGVDRTTGGVAATQTGAAPVDSPAGTRQANVTTAGFYNGNTGAAATYDPTSGMYVDTNGVQIRPDAIRVSNPSAFQSAASPTAPAAPGTASVTAPPTSAFTDQLRALLMSRLQSAQAPVDENSPQIAAQVNAARDEGTRQSEQERTALAERLYAQGGLNTNALTQQIQQSAEKNAANVGNLRGTLLMNAYNQKQQELENDLQLAFASGDAESARQIQTQIANLQATVQREGIGANLAINSANQNAATVGAGL